MCDAGPVTIAAVGDIMPGISYAWRYLTEPSENFASHRLIRGDSEIIDPEPRSILRNADLTVGNMEAVISESFNRANSRTPPLLMAPVETAEFLADSGFDVVHIDNNHILDHGEEFVVETKEHLDAAGVDYIGSPLGEERPTTVSHDGTQIHLAGYNLCAEGRTSDPETVLAMARELATRSGISVLSLHWGWRKVHMLTPSPDQIALAREIADVGVDVVLGHHSHTFQPVEVDDGTVIAYSLGNFIFDMWRPDNRESGIVEITATTDASREAVDRVTVTPVEYTNATVSEATIPRISNAVPTDVESIPADAYEEYAVRAQRHHQKEVIREYARSARRLPLAFHASTLRGWSNKAIRMLWEQKVVG